MALMFLYESLKSLAERYRDLISGQENEFIQLKNDLVILKAILKDAAKETNQEEVFRQLERQIREVVYEVEDTIDMCLTEAMKAGTKTNSLVFINSKRIGLAIQVKSIREGRVLSLLEKVKTMLATRMQIANEDQRTEFKWQDPRFLPNRVVLFEDEEETITGYLMQEMEVLDVIPIIGMPGLGKSALAWNIYNNKNICDHFPIRIWVYISQEFNSRDVFMQILREVIPRPSQDMSGLDHAELVQNVRVCLEKEKFLLVLDDVWSVDDWNLIKEGLPLHNGQSKVVITSREMDVGKRSSLYRKPHMLRFLRLDESWMLLKHEVFENSEDCTQELIPIGEDIANKCGGVPLTVVLIGTFLASQHWRSPSTDAARMKWEMVSEHVDDYVLRDGPEEQIIRNLVASSYHRLPYDLRDCFAYMGLFPEDYEIPVKMLYRLWISEGFIEPPTGSRSTEEILNDLINMNLVKVEKTNHMGEVKTCRVNVLIRAFCMIKSEQHNLFHEIKLSKKTGEIEPPVSEMHQFHRLCIHTSLSNFLSRRPNGPRVRSVFCFHQQPNELEPEYISAIPDGFPKLRILESRSIKFHRFPAKLTKLIHLRYLTLSIETLTSLPEEISQLWNLQTLTVNTNSSSFIMKANMWRMMQLKHFTTTAAIVLDIKWKGEAGENLQTLGMLSAESCTEQVSRRATNLKTLGISGNVAKIFEAKVLVKFQSLEKLKLVNTLIGDELTIEDMLHRRLPQSNCFPPNLKRLTLTKTLLGWKDMSTLSMIKSLEILKLKDNAFVGVSWKVAEYSFPKLQLLLIVNTDLILWQASSDAFPSLRYLVIKKCENLRAIPVYVGTHLEKLEIEHLRDSAVESARKIAESRKREPEGNSADEFHLIIGPGCVGYGA